MKSPLIEGRFTVVGEKPQREPVIKSWANLSALITPVAVMTVIQYARIKGWL